MEIGGPRANMGDFEKGKTFAPRLFSM